MANRFSSHNSPPIPDESQPTASQNHAVPRKPTPPAPKKPVPPSPDQTCIIQISRDQVIRVPPSDNARRMEQYARRKNRRSRCCCVCWLISLILIKVGVAASIIYLLHRIKAPLYTVDRISIHGMNLTSAKPREISPEFNIALRSKNLNSLFGISYQKDSCVNVYYKELRLGNGAFPALFQPSNNVTVFQTALNGSGIEVTSTDAKALARAQNERSVPLSLKLNARVKLKAGPAETWTMTVKANCHVMVDNLTAHAKVISSYCPYGVILWG